MPEYLVKVTHVVTSRVTQQGQVYDDIAGGFHGDGATGVAFLPGCHLHRVGAARAVVVTIVVGLDIPAADAADGLKNLVDTVRDFLSSLNVPLKLADFGIKKADFEAGLPKLAELAHGDISSILSPRPITVDQCEQIMRYAYDGRDIDF